MDKEFLSTAEVALALGISRQAIFKKIKSGDIKAQKIGRSFVINKKDMPEIVGSILSKNDKKMIDESVKKTVLEYGETLKLLGKE
ncbi:MAG: helix-turn-helix domain-containing protein [Candidatus Wolfebacteria bacterium]|nr:helix-turn-helix domain-containing protein [Candidatus Wolfebacteria bacterium]